MERRRMDAALLVLFLVHLATALEVPLDRKATHTHTQTHLYSQWTNVRSNIFGKSTMKQKCHLLVEASQMWWFASFLYYIWICLGFGLLLVQNKKFWYFLQAQEAVPILISQSVKLFSPVSSHRAKLTSCLRYHIYDTNRRVVSSIRVFPKLLNNSSINREKNQSN